MADEKAKIVTDVSFGKGQLQDHDRPRAKEGF